jgi:hypothetical protein
LLARQNAIAACGGPEGHRTGSIEQAGAAGSQAGARTKAIAGSRGGDAESREAVHPTTAIVTALALPPAGSVEFLAKRASVRVQRI